MPGPPGWVGGHTLPVEPHPQGSTLLALIVVLCILVPLGSLAYDLIRKEFKDEL